MVGYLKSVTFQVL